jgi:hypothetical protein
MAGTDPDSTWLFLGDLGSKHASLIYFRPHYPAVGALFGTGQERYHPRLNEWLAGPLKQKAPTLSAGIMNPDINSLAVQPRLIRRRRHVVSSVVLDGF